LRAKNDGDFFYLRKIPVHPRPYKRTGEIFGRPPKNDFLSPVQILRSQIIKIPVEKLSQKYSWVRENSWLDELSQISPKLCKKWAKFKHIILRQKIKVTKFPVKQIFLQFFFQKIK